MAIWDNKQVYIINQYTNPNTSKKVHMINSNGKPLCGADSRNKGTYEYTDEQCNCKRCASMAKGETWKYR